MRRLIKNIVYWVFSPYLIRTASENSIYLTYDDGPYRKNTLAILKVLEKYGFKATFFMLGKEMEKQPEVVKEVIRKGHMLGYHSYTHMSLKKRNFKSLKLDMQHMDRLSKLFNFPLKLYRPPYGDLTLISFIYLIFKRKKIVMWSLDSRDSFEELNMVLERLQPEKIKKGEIILLHDDYKHAEELLEKTARKLSTSVLKCDILN